MSDFPGVRALRRRTLILRVVVLAALLVVLVGLALLWPRPVPGGLTVSTVASDSVGASGVLQGPLVAARHGDRACYTLTARGTTSVLRFVEGWSADEHLGLKDPSGAVVAQPGATVILLGAPGDVGTVEGCPERGRVWTITATRTPPVR